MTAPMDISPGSEGNEGLWRVHKEFQLRGDVHCDVLRPRPGMKIHFGVSAPVQPI